MHGVPVDLDLAFLHGAELVQVCLGVWQIQFHFHPGGSIFVQGNWELLSAAGEQVDRSHDGPERPPFELHRLLGRTVDGTEVSAPDSFSLRFDGGNVLRVYGSLGQYEDFEIWPRGIIG
jgi:hypothetical protein